MSDANGPTMIARCVVCRGDIFHADPYEHTDTGFYCQRHSLPYLRARAEEYRRLLERRQTDADAIERAPPTAVE